MSGGRPPGRRILPEEDEGDALDEEIRFHIEARVERLVAEGWDEAEARREAGRRFGDVRAARAAMEREERMRRWTMGWRTTTNDLRTDLKVAFRQWRHRPGAVVLAIVTLALGIGATTAIFSMVDGILLRPLPYPEPERLTAIWSDWTERGGPEKEWFAWPDLADIRENVDAFEEVGVWGGFSPVLTGLGDPEQLIGVTATPGTLSRVLRVRPQLGRLPTEADDLPGGAGVVLVSDEFWRTRLDADPEVIGRTLVLHGTAVEVIGVLPAGFRSPIGPAGGRIDVWITPNVDPAQLAGSRGSASWRAIARLAPGVEIEEANGRLAAWAERARADFPVAYEGKTPVAWSLREDLVGPVASGMRLVLGAVVLVLLLTALNVANLVLARNSARAGELSVRAALGANRLRLVRQLSVETLALGLVGGTLGVALGIVGVRGLTALAPAGTPRLDQVSVDGRVLAIAILVTLLATAIAGLLPAISATRRNPADAMNSSGRGGGVDRRGLRIRTGLVVVQVAVAVALMATAGVIGRSFQELRSVDMGFDPDDVLSFFVSLPGESYDDIEARAAFHEELDARFRAIPGVEGAGGVSALPLAGLNTDVNYRVEDAPPPQPGEETAAWIRRVTPGYFDAMDLRLEAGRGIEPSDQRGGDPVVVVNRTLAERRFPGENPLGRRLMLGDPADPLLLRIVGVVGDVRHFGIRDDFRDAIYISNVQYPGRSLFFALEAGGDVDPSALLPAARRVLSEMDGTLALARVEPMRDRVASALGPDRFLTGLLGGFATLALILSVVGLYGVVSWSVTARMREVGVRMALGAESGRIRALVVGQGLLPVWLGLALGMVLAWIGSRLASSLLYGVSALDPVALGGTLIVLLGTATIATLVPAVRATRVDPIRVLRDA